MQGLLGYVGFCAGKGSGFRGIGAAVVDVGDGVTGVVRRLIGSLRIYAFIGVRILDIRRRGAEAERRISPPGVGRFFLLFREHVMIHGRWVVHFYGSRDDV